MSDSLNKVCAFTGHRDITEEIDLNGLDSRLQEVVENGYTTFLCGMARGFDLIAAEAVLKLKEQNQDIKLIACIPCPGQERYYSFGEKDKYRRVLKKCDEVNILSDRYYTGCMQMRDRYMVDNCDLVFAYCKRNSGGTYYTLKYAVKNNKKIIIM
ncbi:MAG: DUF1273 domain-containing protein [Clostridia bacterium]|nr:DUF1273 domain-containing protein [Clostridia bacterium]